eukprot:356420-Chlamydomonas_euryale.AAC.1
MPGGRYEDIRTRKDRATRLGKERWKGRRGQSQSYKELNDGEVEQEEGTRNQPCWVCQDMRGRLQLSRLQFQDVAHVTKTLPDQGVGSGGRELGTESEMATLGGGAETVYISESKPECMYGLVHVQVHNTTPQIEIESESELQAYPQILLGVDPPGYARNEAGCKGGQTGGATDVIKMSVLTQSRICPVRGRRASCPLIPLKREVIARAP